MFTQTSSTKNGFSSSNQAAMLQGTSNSRKTQIEEFECVTVKNTEWDHDMTSTLDNGLLGSKNLLVDLTDMKSPAEKLLSDNNSFIMDTDSDYNGMNRLGLPRFAQFSKGFTKTGLEKKYSKGRIVNTINEM